MSMGTNAAILMDYSGSKDYLKLAELAKKSSVICMVDYKREGKEPIRDVARTGFDHHHGEEVFQIGARGITYVHAFGLEEFLQFCALYNVEYLVPREAESQNHG